MQSEGEVRRRKADVPLVWEVELDQRLHRSYLRSVAVREEDSAGVRERGIRHCNK